MMLYFTGDNSFYTQILDRRSQNPIIGFGATGSENNFLGRSIQLLGDCLSRELQNTFGFSPKTVC